MAGRRTRRPAAESRRIILEAAEKRLRQGGPDAVRVQPIARDLGMTDAAIHHHFGSRRELVTELLEFGGRRLREALRSATGPSMERGFDLERFVEAASQVFSDQGYARLALWLSARGWRERGSGIFDELAAGIERRRPHPRDEPSGDSRQLAALLALVLMAEPVFGRAARLSVSLPGDARAAREFRAYLTRTFESLVAAGRPRRRR